MSNPDLDKTLTQQLICASIQTYRAYNAGSAFPGSNPLQFIGDPEGLTYVDRFYGQDVFDGESVHNKVLFGLIFSVNGKPGSFVFAFRGTKGISEWIDDLKIPKTPFKPFHPNPKAPVPEETRVEDGFWEIYQSMQASLFQLISNNGVKKLYVTGHSLGSSLAELFTLDVAISLEIPVTSLNFACPRTGTQAWTDYYDCLTRDKGNPTIRVVNIEDLVPKCPPQDLGYAHVGEAYNICFKDKDFHILPHYGFRHSADNYARTLAHLFGTPVDCQLEVSKLDNLEFC